jgi:tetratricopeptide (TPR) repeat protein
MKPVVRPALAPIAALLLLAACVPSVRRDPSPDLGRPEAVSLFGNRLYPPELPLERRTRLEADLAAARRAYEARPDNADALIWYGRRLGYLGRYRDAIAVYSEGIARHPRDARMYRHRGHRLITLRRFEHAIRDLRLAARLTAGQPDQVEPDGMPNAQNVPLSTLQGNIWYHLGLAHYLRGDWGHAAEGFRQALARARNDDSIVAASDWLYMSLRRGNRPAEAARVLEPIRRDMRITENTGLHRRLLMYRGEIPADSLLTDEGDGTQLANVGYGVGNWHLYNGRRREAEDILWRVVQAENWAPFGYIAAEADLRRLERSGRR